MTDEAPGCQPARQAAGLPRPASPARLFVAFTLLALQGFGGVAAVVQRELVERRRWLSADDFLEDWAVAQILPGPNVVNLALTIGARYFGLRGALAALAGMLGLPLLVVLALATLYTRFADLPQVAGALRGMAAVAAGLLAAAGLRSAGALRRHPLPLAWSAALCVLAFVLVAWLRLPLLAVLLGVGGAGCVLTWRRLR